MASWAYLSAYFINLLIFYWEISESVVILKKGVEFDIEIDFYAANSYYYYFVFYIWRIDYYKYI